MRYFVFGAIGIWAGLSLALTADIAYDPHRSEASPAVVAPSPEPPIPPARPEPFRFENPRPLSESTFHVDQNALSFELWGATETRIFEIRNTAKGRIEWSATPTNNAIRISPNTGVLSAGERTVVSVSVTSAPSGTESVLVVASPSKQLPHTISVKIQGFNAR